MTAKSDVSGASNVRFPPASRPEGSRKGFAAAIAGFVSVLSRPRGSPEVPEFLRHDLGLPPSTPEGRHWDHL